MSTHLRLVDIIKLSKEGTLSDTKTTDHVTTGMWLITPTQTIDRLPIAPVYNSLPFMLRPLDRMLETMNSSPESNRMRSSRKS